MHNVRKISENLYWIGGNDRRINLFENLLPIRKGISYNSYLLIDEKTVLFDTADNAVGQLFFDNLKAALNDRKLDYIIIHHVEPDHTARLEELLIRYPEVKIVGNSKAVTFITQFFDADLIDKVKIVNDGDSLNAGKHTLKFILAPMIHWPEVMMTYDLENKTLFSADAFGAFGTLDGNIFSDEIDYEHKFLEEARLYYTNIVGKYGLQVQNILKKTKTLEIKTICPLHGYIWRKNISWFIEKYDKWSKYEPEDKGVMIAFASMYGHTENAVEILASKLAENGVKNIAIYDVSRTDSSVLLSEAFRTSHIVVAAPTYNNCLNPNMESFLLNVKAHNLQNRTWAIIENGTWAPVSGKIMRSIIEQINGKRFINSTSETAADISFKSSIKENCLEAIFKLADLISNDLGVHTT